MPQYSGSCLCGALSFRGEGDILNVMNCHCDDCRKATGAAYGTLVFVKSDEVEITGDSISYAHKSDRGSDMVKHSCIKCGSPVYGTNSAREGMISLRAGAFEQKNLVQPKGNVYCDSKIASTPLDQDIKAFAKMPG